MLRRDDIPATRLQAGDRKRIERRHHPVDLVDAQASQHRGHNFRTQAGGLAFQGHIGIGRLVMDRGTDESGTLGLLKRRLRKGSCRRKARKGCNHQTGEHPF